MVEVKKYYIDTFKTSEYAKDWTETSSDSKFREIIRIMDNKSINGIPEVEKLKDLASRREYREIQRKVGVPINQCDGKLGKNSLAHFGNYIDKVRAAHRLSSSFGREIASLHIDMGALENITDTLQIQHAEQQYLAAYETMSDYEYRSLFAGRENLQQGQLGDCYLVSGINELAHAQHFDTLMRTSIQRVTWKDGSGSGYQIKIPLGEPSGRKILLKDSELSVAKIRGNDGYKIIELAYAKNKLRKNDKKGNRYAPITEEELKRIEGGWTHEVLTTFLGKNNIGFCDFGTMKNYIRGKRLSNSSKMAKWEITNFLRNYNPKIGNKFISLASLKGESDQKSYTVGDKTLFYKHAYSLHGVKRDSAGNILSLRVLNPWNARGEGKNYQDFTLEEFFDSFSAISCGKIKTSTFLNQKSIA